MKRIRHSLLLVVMLIATVTAWAQTPITSDFTITKPIFAHKLGDDLYKVDSSTNKATLRVFVFNGYITYEIELAGPFFAEACKSQNKMGDKFYFTWSGSSNRLMAAHDNRSQEIFMLADKNGRIDGILGENSNDWICAITGQVDNCIMDIHTGITFTELQQSIKNLTQYTSIKESGSVGDLKEYTVYGAQLHDRIFEDKVDVKTDNPFAKFYFNANGRLVKWYMMK